MVKCKGCGHDYLLAFSASFSQQPMAYVAAGDSSSGTAKVISASMDGKTSKTFEAVDSLAQPTTHIPNRRAEERIDGHHSDVFRFQDGRSR